jgi:hypothetical protein
MTSTDFTDGFAAGRGEAPFDQSRVLDRQYVQGWREGQAAETSVKNPISQN